MEHSQRVYDSDPSDDDKLSSRSSIARSSIFRAAAREQITQQPDATEGSIYTRRAPAIPLGELLARQHEAKLSLEDDDEEDEDTEAAIAARRAKAAQAQAEVEKTTDIEVSPEEAAAQQEQAESPATDAEAAIPAFSEETIHEIVGEPDEERRPGVDRPAHAAHMQAAARLPKARGVASVPTPPAASHEQQAPVEASEAEESIDDVSEIAPPVASRIETPQTAEVSHNPVSPDTPRYQPQSPAMPPFEAGQPVGYAPVFAPAAPNFAPLGGAEYSTPAPVYEQHLNFRQTSEVPQHEHDHIDARDRRLFPAMVTAVGVAGIMDYFSRNRIRREQNAQHATMQKSHEQLADQQQQFVAEQRTFNEQQQAVYQDQQRLNETQTRHIQETQRLQAEQREQLTALPFMPRAEQAPVVTPSRPDIRRFDTPPTVERPRVAGVTPEETQRLQAEQQRFRAQQEQVKAAQQVELEQQQQQNHVEAQNAWQQTLQNQRNQEASAAPVYGDAYRQERQQEIIRDHTGDTGNSRTGSQASSVGAAGTYAQSQYTVGGQYTTLPSGMTTPSLPQGQYVDPQHQLSEGKDKPERETIKSNITNPWFWLMLLLIGAAFFTAALI